MTNTWWAVGMRTSRGSWCPLRSVRPACKKGVPAGAQDAGGRALLSQGLPDRDIAGQLFISPRTVHHHVSSILAKIGVSSRTAAARQAARIGIGTQNWDSPAT